jgi:hypothetical protein
MHIGQDQEEQSSDQKKVKFTSLKNQMVRFLKPEYPVLTEQELTWLKKMIAPRQVLTMTLMMMILMTNMMIKSSYWSFKNL